MPRRWLPTVCLCAGWWLLVGARAAAPAAEPSAGDFFEKSVRPLLAAHCLGCHGPDKQRARLRLDSRAAVLAGGRRGPAVLPGRPDESLLLGAVTYRGEPKMPPDVPLSAAQVAVLRTWIQQGAPWPQAVAAVR